MTPRQRTTLGALATFRLFVFTAFITATAMFCFEQSNLNLSMALASFGLLVWAGLAHAMYDEHLSRQELHRLAGRADAHQRDMERDYRMTHPEGHQ